MRVIQTAQKILIVDDETSICSGLKMSLEAEGYSVDVAFSGKAGLDNCRKITPDVTVLDLRLPDIDGIAMLKEIKEIDEDIIVIMITAFGDTRDAVEAVKNGAYDFITKPFDVNELKISIHRALKERTLKNENTILKAQDHKSVFITQDKQLLHILNQLDFIAKPDPNVLIEGETGTGKELIARLIHEKSNRAEKPFVTLNCSTLPANLFESELFGHEKNAFTGASGKKRGLLELADEGSFFFDEIGELPLQLQSKLLRFLEDRSIRRIGGLTQIPLNVRIIAATNKSLKEEIEKNMFRSDLYYRLNVVLVHIPPLRERVGDIPLLLDFYAKMFNRKFNKNVMGFSDKAMKILKNYNWPGNVRELKNILERAFILVREDYITENELPLELTDEKTSVSSPTSEGTSLSLEELEKHHISQVMDMTRWNITKAAELLGISRFALQRRIKKYFD